MKQPYVIFFEGLNQRIDKDPARRLAKNRGCVAIFFPYRQWRKAVDLPHTNPDIPYHVVGFSRGAAPDIMGGFMTAVRHAGYRLPEDLMTVGLFGGTHRYVDADYECINFLDSSGQSHDGEHNAFNLGANVPHQGLGSGMELVADMFADGNVPSIVAASTPEAQAAAKA